MLTTEDKKKMENNKIIKGNKLVESKYDNLTAVEYKIILVALSKLKPTDETLGTIVFSVGDFCELLNVQKKGMYKHIEKACDSIISKSLTIKKSSKSWKKYNWTSNIACEYGIITIKFNQDLKRNLLFSSNTQYTKYILKNIIHMKSKYSMRLYEILKQYQQISNRTFKVEELRQHMGIEPSKHKQYKIFKRDVLLPAISEINRLTDLNITYKQIKKGRCVESIKFAIKYVSNENVLDMAIYHKTSKNAIIRNIQKQIYDLVGISISFKNFEHYHRLILITLLAKLESKIYDKIKIEYPESFFKWQLKDINSNYDEKKLFDRVKDF